MNQKEKDKFNIIEKVIKGKMTQKEAIADLNLKIYRQQVYRLIKTCHEKGECGFINGNRGKINPNKFDNQLLDEIKQIYYSEYYDYSIIAFYEVINEKYKDKYDISYSTLYRMFLNDDIISPLAHKRTIKFCNEKMKKAINDNEIIQEKKSLEE